MSENTIKKQGGTVEELVEPKARAPRAPRISKNEMREPVAEAVAPEEVKAEPVKAKPRKKNTKASRNLVRFMNSFGIFERNQIVNAMPFILFLTVLIIGYIANSYYAERVIREIDKSKVDLKERRAEYISTMSRLMYQSKQSEVAHSLQATGLKESTEPPKKIFVEEKPVKK